MRVLMTGVALSVLSIAASAQQPAAPAASAAASRTMGAAEIWSMVAKAKADRKENQPTSPNRWCRLAPYGVNLEYRASFATGRPQKGAELFYVVDGPPRS